MIWYSLFWDFILYHCCPSLRFHVLEAGEFPFGPSRSAWSKNAYSMHPKRCIGEPDVCMSRLPKWVCKKRHVLYEKSFTNVPSNFVCCMYLSEFPTLCSANCCRLSCRHSLVLILLVVTLSFLGPMGRRKEGTVSSAECKWPLFKSASLYFNSPDLNRDISEQFRFQTVWANQIKQSVKKFGSAISNERSTHYKT